MVCIVNSHYIIVMYVVIIGGWRRVYTEETLGGRILMLTCTGGYIQALDNGSFCVGQPRTEGQCYID